MMSEQRMETGSQETSTKTPAPEAGKAEPVEVTGTVKSYQSDKGFGFIARHGEADVFFHISNLANPEAPPEVGQRVRFALVPSKKKPGTLAALNVRPEGEAPREIGSQGHG